MTSTTVAKIFFFTKEDVSIVSKMCAEQWLHVCNTSFNSNFTEIEYTVKNYRQAIQTLFLPKFRYQGIYHRVSACAESECVCVNEQRQFTWTCNKHACTLTTLFIKTPCTVILGNDPKQFSFKMVWDTN